MKIFARSKWIFTFVLITLFSTAQAEQFETFGDHEIHYIVFSSELLRPEVAQQYGLERARNLAIVNISVLNTHPLAGNKPVTATMQGSFTNLAQQKKRLDFRQITEGDAVYYIASLEYTNRETLKFDIQFQPKGSKHISKLTFNQQLYFEPKK